jgi:hypothetical protein
MKRELGKICFGKIFGKKKKHSIGSKATKRFSFLG